MHASARDAFCAAVQALTFPVRGYDSHCKSRHGVPTHGTDVHCKYLTDLIITTVVVKVIPCPNPRDVSTLHLHRWWMVSQLKAAQHARLHQR